MAFVLVRVATPFLRVLQVLRDGLGSGDPVTSNLPRWQFPALGEKPQVTGTEPRHGRRFGERDESLVFQRPLA